MMLCWTLMMSSFLIEVKTTVLHVYGIARKLFHHRCPASFYRFCICTNAGHYCEIIHLNSFVLYYPNAEVVDEEVAYLTVVILMHTSRIHILSNMSDHLLQFIQYYKRLKGVVVGVVVGVYHKIVGR